MKHKAFGAALVLLAGSMSCDRSVSLPTTGSINVVIVSESGNLLSVSAPGSADVEQRDGGLANVTIDGARLTVTGPTNKTVTVTQATGSNFELVADGLTPGTYSVRVEGLVAGEVAHYGETSSIQVVAGQQTPASVTFPPFLATTGVVVPDTTDVLRFTVNYSAIQNATGYIVQWSKSPTMTNPSSKNVGGTSTDVTVTDEGNYYVTVRATNAAVPGGGKASPAAVVFAFQGVASVTVTPPSPTIAYGAAQQMSAEGRDADNAVVPNVTWFWSSSNPGAAQVNQSGLVTGVGPGQATITAVGKGMPGSTSLTVSSPPASKLLFTVQPSSATAGQAMTGIKVAVQNVLGQTVTTDNTTQITLAIGTNAGGGSLGGTVTATAVAGVATFNTVSINKTGTGYTLTAAANALDGATTGAFNVYAGTPAQLAFSVQPPNGAAGDALSPAVQVEVQDALGNLATNARNAISMSIGSNPGGAVLSGATTVNAVGGVATFSNVSLDKAGTGYTLAASASGLTGATSATFNVAASGPAAALAFVTQPADATSNQTIVPSIQVAVKDAVGRTVASDNTTQVTLAIGTNPGSGTLAGTAVATASSGIATFTDLRIDKAASGYTLLASAASLNAATSSPFGINPGAPARLAFSVQPANTIAGDALSPAVQVEVRDAAGNRVTTARDEVVIAIANNPSIGGAGALTGTKKVNAIDGIASFTGVWINKTGSGYTLSATSGALTAATSSAFNIAPAAPAKLAFAQQPSNAQGNVIISPSPTVTITDQFDNATTATNNVTIGIGDNPWKTPFAAGGSLAGTLTVAAVNGTATFPGLRVDKPAPGYTLAASAPLLSGSSSSAFNINLTVSQVAAGGNHTCVVATGGPYCFGFNSSGQLGFQTGSTSRDSIAGLVRGGLVFTQVTTGSSHSCGITAAGAAYCWGANGNGQLGDGTTTTTGPSGTPVAVSGGLVFASIDAGASHTCGITTASANAAVDRQVYCWGYNGLNQLGDGTATQSTTPVRVAEPLRTVKAASLSAGGNHTCAVATNGNAYCWGYDAQGQLGDDAPLVNKSVPTLVAGGATWLAITAGDNHTCGIISLPPDSPGRCWGYNYYGQLGDNTTLDAFGANGVSQPTPVAVFGNLNFSMLSAGGIHTCGVTTGGSGYCWGYNQRGELGDDLLGTNTSVRSAVAGGLTFVTIQAGSAHSCGRTAAAVYCWGTNNTGQLGSPGLGTNKRTPTQIVQ